MKIFRIASLFCLLLFTAPRVKAQIYSATNEDSVYYLKLANGSNAVVKPLPYAPTAELTIYVMAGSMFENDSMNGIAYIVQRIINAKINSYLQSRTGTLNSLNTSLQSYTTNERTIFTLTIPADSTYAGLQLLIKYILKATVEESLFKATIDSVLLETERDKQIPKKQFEDKILKSLYRSEFEKMNGKGNPDELKKIELPDVIRYLRKYYFPNNTIVIASGNLRYMTFRNQFEDLFNPLIRSEFDPEFITKITDFKPMTYTSQFIIEDSTATPEFNICWQFPGTNSGSVASYSAALLVSILNDPNNFIQVKAAKMHCKKLVAQYEAGNYSGILRVIIQPDTSNFYATYKFVLTQLLRLEKTLVNEDMMNAAKLQFKKDFELSKKTKEFPEQVVKHWVYKDDSYYRFLADSVMTVREKKLKIFVLEYMNLNSHVTGLLISKAERERLKIDSVFADVNDSVGKYVFRYLQNVTDLEGTDNLTMLQNLLQWLQMNGDVNIQVNGFSDKKEFNKTHDPAVMSWIDSIPTFRKATSDIIEKGYLPPETMRAMKMVKYLYEHGITADRLSGTAMRFSSDNDQQAIDNAKCTVTLDKLHKSMPLREYHFTKPKE